MQEQKQKKSMLREYAEALSIALVLALFIRTFGVQAFKIPSESMLSTLLVGDHLLGLKFSYGLKWPFTHSYIFKGPDPERGDVIIFEFPKDPSVDYIKRIVGIPVDVVELRDKRLYRNGELVDEPFARYVAAYAQDPRCTNFGPVTVPEGKYFVLGDNRDNSLDSRFWGFVDRTAIRAKAWRIYWSGNGLDIRWNRMGRLVE